MSDYSLSSAFIDMWAADVHLQFQQEKSVIRDACRTVTGVTAHTYHFPILNAGTATVNRAALSDLVPDGASYSTTAAVMSKLDDVKLIDFEEEVQTNASLRQAFTKATVQAISRGLDDLIITQLDATTNDGTTDLTNAYTLDRYGLSEMSDLLSLNNVPLDDDRFAVISVGGNKDIMQDSELVSDLFVEKGAMTDGLARRVMGFNMILSNRTLVPSSTKHNCYFFHKQAVGLAIANDIELRIDPIYKQGAWQFWARMVAGAVVIDPNGVYKATIAD